MIAQLVFSGLALGSMYALVALGYNITYATSQTVNFSQGQSVMVGAVVAYALYVGLGWPFWVALPITLVALALLGVIVERVAVRPFLQARSIAWLLATIAVGIIGENVAMLLFGKDARAFPSSLAVSPWMLFFRLTVLAVTNCAYSQAAAVRLGSPLAKKVQLPTSW